MQKRTPYFLTDKNTVFPAGTAVNLYSGVEPKYSGSTVVAHQDSLDDQFLEFHRLHPEVYETLVRIARETKKRYSGYISMRMIWEVARWELLMKNPGADHERMNNNYHSRYARMIMANEADLRDLFKTRKLKT